MKAKYIKRITALGFVALLSFSACLKDDAHYFNPEATQSSVAMLINSGLANFGKDAVTAPGIDTVKFGVAIAQLNPLASATTVVIGVDNTYVTSYNAANSAINYQTIPSTAYTLPATNITVPAGSNSVIATVYINRNLLNPSLSYMLPIKIVSASGITISANDNVHYYHIIGNDFAGAYIWDYRRWQNGTGPGAGQIPSQGQGLPPDISTIGAVGAINPIGPTEIAMLTGYNGTGVNYDITFTRTAGTPVTYTNWNVFFNATEIAKWTAAGITNMVPPAFTVPPPANSNAPKFFEMNYVSGGAAGRYIDDTYH